MALVTGLSSAQENAIGRGRATGPCRVQVMELYRVRVKAPDMVGATGLDMAWAMGLLIHGYGYAHVHDSARAAVVVREKAGAQSRRCHS